MMIWERDTLEAWQNAKKARATLVYRCVTQFADPWTYFWPRRRAVIIADVITKSKVFFFEAKDPFLKQGVIQSTYTFYNGKYYNTPSPSEFFSPGPDGWERVSY